MKRHRVLVVAGIVAAVLTLSSYASPYWTLHRMKTAIDEKDAARFSSYVDFPALRESIKQQMLVMMKQQLPQRDSADHPFAGIGQMMGAALINPLVDAAVSPASVIAMFESGKAQPVPAETGEQAPQAEEDGVDYAVDYATWNRVVVSKRDNDAGRFILKRTGLWSWQLVALELPKAAFGPAE